MPICKWSGELRASSHPRSNNVDSWVFSTLTPSSESKGHSLYNPKTSGKIKTGYSWNITYGDGSGAAGTVYADKVVVGGVTATSQAVEAATSVSAQFEQDTDSKLISDPRSLGPLLTIRR